MNQTPDRRGWLEFSRTTFKLRFLYPAVTPRGRPVEIAEEEHDGANRVQLTAREGDEVYLELVRFPDLQPPDEYARPPRLSRGTVRPRGGQRADAVEPAGTARLHLRVPRERLERAVLSLQVGRDTYRIISDPRARLNDDIIATVTIITASGQ